MSFGEEGRVHPKPFEDAATPIKNEPSIGASCRTLLFISFTNPKNRMTAENLMESHIRKLMQVLPPPESPKNNQGDWNAVKKYLGTILPSDYKEFTEAYGTV
jgi:hypothetical protein